MTLDPLVEKQKQLMDFVPHDVRPTSFVKMEIGLQIIDVLLKYLNSTGHKPWRPTPLFPSVQQGLLNDLDFKVKTLHHVHLSAAGVDGDFSPHYSRQLVSTYGIIEEAVEYINSLGTGTRAEQLEELTDILFFYLEQMILGGFTWAEIVKEYDRKWNVNMERYRRAKQGNYDWDDRGKKSEL